MAKYLVEIQFNKRSHVGVYFFTIRIDMAECKICLIVGEIIDSNHEVSWVCSRGNYSHG